MNELAGSVLGYPPYDKGDIRVSPDFRNLDWNRGPGTFCPCPRFALLQCPADIVDAFLWVMRIHHLEDHIVTGLELSDHGVKCWLGSRGLTVDAS